jgi:hypothetical protein
MGPVLGCFVRCCLGPGHVALYQNAPFWGKPSELFVCSGPCLMCFWSPWPGQNRGNYIFFWWGNYIWKETLQKPVPALSDTPHPHVNVEQACCTAERAITKIGWAFSPNIEMGVRGSGGWTPLPSKSQEFNNFKSEVLNKLYRKYNNSRYFAPAMDPQTGMFPLVKCTHADRYILGVSEWVREYLSAYVHGCCLGCSLGTITLGSH